MDRELVRESLGEDKQLSKQSDVSLAKRAEISDVFGAS